MPRVRAVHVKINGISTNCRVTNNPSTAAVWLKRVPAVAVYSHIMQKGGHWCFSRICAVRRSGADYEAQCFNTMLWHRAQSFYRKYA